MPPTSVNDKTLDTYDTHQLHFLVLLVLELFFIIFIYFFLNLWLTTNIMKDLCIRHFHYWHQMISYCKDIDCQYQEKCLLFISIDESNWVYIESLYSVVGEYQLITLFPGRPSNLTVQIGLFLIALYSPVWEINEWFLVGINLNCLIALESY